MLQETQLESDRVTLNLAAGPSAGPPLLLLHGVARCWQDYITLIPTLGTRWQVMALDFRGHGRSSRATSYRVVDYVRDAAAVVARNASEPVVVYGHSLGAMVAAAVAAELPGQVRAIVLEDPPFGTLGANIRQTVYHGMFAAFGQLAASGQTVDELVALLAGVTLATPGKSQRLRLGELRDPAALRFMAKCLSQLDPATMTPLVEGCWLDGYDQDDLLRRVACPTLLLQGEASQGSMLDDAEAARVTALLPRATHVRVAGAGHLIHSMQTETTLRLVTSFLESL
ncbi:MAG TPA: alpha/beta hydrolase [Pirellulales bacterium]|jgi:pimeloyl-ACP methyl ester carboxylesterase